MNRVVGDIIVKLTNHFTNRYFERVLKTTLPDIDYNNLKQIVSKDMDLKMTSLQKNNMEFISGSSSNAKIPMGKDHRVITENNVAITIY